MAARRPDCAAPFDGGAPFPWRGTPFYGRRSTHAFVHTPARVASRQDRLKAEHCRLPTTGFGVRSDDRAGCQGYFFRFFAFLFFFFRAAFSFASRSALAAFFFSSFLIFFQYSSAAMKPTQRFAPQRHGWSS